MFGSTRRTANERPGKSASSVRASDSVICSSLRASASSRERARSAPAAPGGGGGVGIGASAADAAARPRAARFAGGGRAPGGRFLGFAIRATVARW